jgi:hypothetical protein
VYPVLSSISWIPAFAGMTNRGVLQSSLFAEKVFPLRRDTGNFFGERFFVLKIALARDHDPLCLRRTGSMHRFRAIANGCRSERNIFDKA